MGVRGNGAARVFTSREYEGKFAISSLRYSAFFRAGSLTSRNARHTASNCTKQLIKCQCFVFLLARLDRSKTWRPQIAPSAALLARSCERKGAQLDRGALSAAMASRGLLRTYKL